MEVTGYYHVSRGWHGDPEWFMDCCPHEACGYTDPMKWTDDCPNHNFSKTIRNRHLSTECPGAQAVQE